MHTSATGLTLEARHRAVRRTVKAQVHCLVSRPRWYAELAACGANADRPTRNALCAAVLGRPLWWRKCLLLEIRSSGFCLEHIEALSGSGLRGHAVARCL